MHETLARLEELLAQTDAPQSEIRSMIEQIEAREVVSNAMQAFIESQYRDEFEETLSFEEQEQYRQVFELDSNEGLGMWGDEESGFSRDS
jgi:hypothetical protein